MATSTATPTPVAVDPCSLGTSHPGYNGSGGTVANIGCDTQTSGSPELPFTGFDAGLIALLGSVLVATGYALRKKAKRPSYAVDW